MLIIWRKTFPQNARSLVWIFSKLGETVLFCSGEGLKPADNNSFHLAVLREHWCLSCSSLTSMNSVEASDATTEFITLNERLCSRPHSITQEPDDELHFLPWLHDPEVCLINLHLHMTTISRRNVRTGLLWTFPHPHIIICHPATQNQNKGSETPLWDFMEAFTCCLNVMKPRILIRLAYLDTDFHIDI